MNNIMDHGGVIDTLKSALLTFKSNHSSKEYGVVDSISKSLITVYGLKSATMHSIVVFNTDDLLNRPLGVVIGIDKYRCDVILLRHMLNNSIISGKTEVILTDRLLEVSLSEHMIGQTLDAYGCYKGKPIQGEKRPLQLSIPSIHDIKELDTQIITGISAIDIMTPISMGQRQAIIGNSSTGKTTIATTIMISQKYEPKRICIYLCIGQVVTSAIKLKTILLKHNALNNIIINVPASSSLCERYFAPNTAMVIAKYFQTKGYDVIVILDDLSTHADSFRELALLRSEKMGREFFPGDIFYMHATLLSLGHVSIDKGSITILPIIRVQDDDFTSYIPTNIMSITDGQLILNSKYNQKEIYPSIDSMFSVTRIGRHTQHPYFKKLSEQCYNILVQYDAVNQISNLTDELNQENMRLLSLGIQIKKYLQQEGILPRSLKSQIFNLFQILNNKRIIDIDDLELLPFDIDNKTYDLNRYYDICENIYGELSTYDNL